MRFLLFLAVIVVAGLSSVMLPRQPSSNELSQLPAQQAETKPPPLPITATISATSAIIVDASTGAILAAKNPDQRLMPASTTKMMTAYIALRSYALDEVIPITRSWDAIGKSTKFTLGEQYQVIDILKAALINSGNDAALSLADHFPGGYPAFVAQMNTQAIYWGLKNTHFTNVSGVEEEGHYSSAADLAVIARYFMQEPILKEIVGQKTTIITSIDNKYRHQLTNTNELLGKIPGLIGIKTGWTDNAGECLVTYIDKDRDLIFVVLNSTNRFDDTRTLIDWSSDL